MPELLISWVVLGIVAGMLVYMFSSKRIPGGLFGNLAVGVVGAFAGGYLISVATGVDVLESSLTWGILLTALFSALAVGVLFQTQAPERIK